MPTTHEFVATCTRGAEEALAAELRAMLGDVPFRPDRGAVRWKGPLSSGYRACLWSRLASRVLLVLRRFDCRDADALYGGVHAEKWKDHMGVHDTLAVDFIGTSPTIRNSRFGAVRTKDAIVDRIRGQGNERPGIDLRAPDVRVNVHLRNGEATLSIDLSGDSLHRRGDRGRHSGPAPLKETLAATMLHYAEWPRLAKEGAPLVDPMCGTGTILVEAGGMARDEAPGLYRRRWGFSGWRGHDADAWKALADEANERANAGADTPVHLFGSDIDARAIEAAEDNASRAEMPLRLQRLDAADATPPEDFGPGLVVTNPPYGERMGDEEAAIQLMRMLGDTMRRRFLGWSAWILAGSPKLGRNTGLKPSRKIELHNGPIDCRLVRLDISDRPVQREV